MEVIAVLIAIVFIWRGIWGLQDVYMKTPEDLAVGYLISIAIGLVILLFVGKKIVHMLV